MPTFHAGDELVETFKLITPNNDPITGAVQGVDLDIDITLDPAGSSFASGVVIAESSAGWYIVTYQSSAASPVGHYLVGIVYTGANPRSFEIEWDIEGEAITTPATVASIVAGPTLQAVRRSVLKQLGDLTVLTATAATTSSIFEDVDNLVQGSGNYAARELFVTGGTIANVGQRRRVSGSSSQGKLQLARALPDAVAIGDEAELNNRSGVGITHDDVMDQIQHSISIARPTVPISVDIAGTFDPVTRGIVIPDDLYAIDRVEYQFASNDYGSWFPVQKARAQGEYGYWPDSVSRTVYIGGNAGSELYAATIRIYGLALVTAPVNDDDIVPVDLEWITYRTAADLALRPLRNSASPSGSELQSMGMLWDDRANKMLSRIRSRPRTGRTVLA